MSLLSKKHPFLGLWHLVPKQKEDGRSMFFPIRKMGVVCHLVHLPQLAS